jgi:hypothetical protein
MHSTRTMPSDRFDHVFVEPSSFDATVAFCRDALGCLDWALKDTGSKGRANVDVALVGHEKVRVLAGEFDAFKIESKASFRGISKVGGVVEGASTGTYWYAPAARTIVKSVTLNPYRGTPTVELVGFQLQP